VFGFLWPELSLNNGSSCCLRYYSTRESNNCDRLKESGFVGYVYISDFKIFSIRLVLSSTHGHMAGCSISDFLNRRSKE